MENSICKICGWRGTAETLLCREQMFARVTLLRGEIESVSGQFDLIMMHHVIEHVAEPEALLRAARARLRPGGRVLVRTPAVASEAFRR